MRPKLLAAGLVSLLLLAGCTSTPPPADDELPPTNDTAGPADDRITAVATDLDTVWEIAFSPDERVFFTERPGRIQVLDSVLDDEPELFRQMTSTVERGESGLMGLALDPGFPDEPWIYVCQTYRDGEDDLRNRVVRVQGEDGPRETLVDGIDASSIHDGCRLAFGPDDLLYMTMGDAAESSRAQDESSLNGKVLRMTRTGEPRGVGSSGWDERVFTMGHRNPQGLDFHPSTGTPYISEHGPENHDEVNALDIGDNYGWPEVRGEDDGDGRFHPAIWSSGPGGTVAPAGAAFVDADGSPLDEAFVFATLKAAQLHVLELGGPDDRQVESETVVFEERFGRLRAATWGPDDALYLSTSNDDGRGNPGPQDDRILRVPLSVLEDEVAG